MELGVYGELVVLLVLLLVALHWSGVDKTDPEGEQIRPGE